MERFLFNAMLLAFAAAVISLPILAGVQEQRENHKLEVTKNWYAAHPKATILIFNCIQPDDQVKCPHGEEIGQ